MREIKFKAWDKEKHQMYYDIGVATSKAPIFSITSEGLYIRPDNTQFELLLYTGLKDKNRKEIYEGDILRSGGEIKIQPFNHNKKVKSPYWEISQIIFSDGCFKKIIVIQSNSYFGKLPSEPKPIFQAFEYEEIIGNIYENPELLEDKP